MKLADYVYSKRLKNLILCCLVGHLENNFVVLIELLYSLVVIVIYHGLTPIPAQRTTNNELTVKMSLRPI